MLMSVLSQKWYCAGRHKLKHIIKTVIAAGLSTNNGNMSQSAKALTAGSALPPLGKGKQRLYSMRFCPFAHRARLVLAHKGVEYETININLGSKPEWFLEKNPNGEVPVLEKDGTIVYDSLVAAEYLDSVHTNSPLVAKDPLRKAQDSMVINYNGSKFVPNYYKIINAKGQDEEANSTLMKALQMLEDTLTKRGSKFFGGDTMGFVDLMIWPWQERFPILGKYPEVDVTMAKFPRMKEWQNLMKEQAAVKACAQTEEMHDKFIVLWKGGDANPYDVGL